ncbi:unnamed protein product [Penicillium glandicola]
MSMYFSIASNMDPFAEVPVEIIWKILESCHDFTSLDGLRQISPRVKEAFNGSFKNITEQVLRNCSLTSHGLHYYFTLFIALLEELASPPGDIMRPILLSTTHSLAAVQQTVKKQRKFISLPVLVFSISSIVSSPQSPVVLWLLLPQLWIGRWIEDFHHLNLARSSDSMLIHRHGSKLIGRIEASGNLSSSNKSIMLQRTTGYGRRMI